MKKEERIQRHMQNLNISREEYENNEDLIKEEAHRYINKDSIFELRISKKTPRKEVLELLQHYEELYDSSKFYSDEYASSKLNIIKRMGTIILRYVEGLVLRLRLRVQTLL